MTTRHLAAGACLAASLGLTGCQRPASEPTATSPPTTTAPVAGTRTAVLTVKGMT